MTATDGLVGSPSSDAETFTHAAEPLLLIQPDGADCSDGLFCNGAEQCVDGVCQASAAPCPLVCDEVGDQCLDSRCPPVAQSGCLTADTSVLVIKNNADNNKDKLIWKWLKGQPTMLDDFGDPQSDADYAWCLYGGVSEALLAGGTIDVPASATKWSPLGTGLKYDDPGATADGAEQLTLKSSTQNRSKASRDVRRAEAGTAGGSRRACNSAGEPPGPSASAQLPAFHRRLGSRFTCHRSPSRRRRCC